jgi:hypothetical protein
MKKLLLSIVLIFSFVYLQAQGVAGKIYITSKCASGGIDYYFYEDMSVIGICNGCESIPLIQWGTWDIKGSEVIYTMTKQWEGVGLGAPIGPCGSVCLYASYNAKFTAIKELNTLTYEHFEEGYDTGDCTSVEEFFNSKPDVHQTLKNGFKGKYSVASDRLLIDNDLKNLSKQQLKIMRNEIFAGYGYIFKTKEMSDYFKKQNGYVGNMENVDAFLSEVEKKNITLIKKWEAR